MKRILLGIIVFFCFLTVSAQTLPVRYVDAAGNIVEMPTNCITSDFGRRHSTWVLTPTPPHWTPSPWHRGIDYAPIGCNHRSIVTIASGRVASITGSNKYKYLVIDGGIWNGGNFVDDNNDFGYGHIFYNGVVGSDGLSSGDFVFLKMDKLSLYAILNKNTDTAIGQIEGAEVTYKGVKYPVVRKINPDQLIAPIGGSGGYPPHLHLYRPQNPGIDAADIPNAKNPFEIVNHDQPSYTITIDHLDALTEASSPTTWYACSSLDEDGNSSVKVKVALGEVGIPVGDGEIYEHSAYNVEDVKLYIKDVTEAAGQYRLIRGTQLESKIVMGGRVNQTRYPNQGNLDIAWKSNNGSNFNGTKDRMGIEPHAYKNGNYDLFWFSDIYSRIQASVNALAPVNKLARYPDGKYDLLAKVTTIRNVTFPNNNTPQKQIIIDNFKPYVEKFDVISMGLHYSSEWVPNTALAQLDHVVGGSFMPVNYCFGATLQVSFSEQMNPGSVMLSIDGHELEQGQPSNHNKTYTFLIPSTTYSENKQMTIHGTDLAGNSVFQLPAGFTQQLPVPFSQIPVRTANGWSVGKSSSEGETSYWLYIQPQSGSCNTTVEQPPVAAFSYSYVNGYPNRLKFTNNSQNACYAYWDFGNGTSSSDLNPGIVSYPALDYSQIYSVKLIVTNSDGRSHSVTQNINVRGGSSSGAGSGNSGGNGAIDLSSTYYYWQGGNTYLFDVNATGASYYDFTIDYGDGHTADFTQSFGFEQSVYTYNQPGCSTNYVPVVYCRGYDASGFLVGEAFQELPSVPFAPEATADPKLNVSVVSDFNNTVFPGEFFKLKAVLVGSQDNYDWEWRIFNTKTPDDPSTNCNEAGGCITFMKRNSTFIQTDTFRLPSAGTYKSRIWVWNGTFGGWFDYNIEVLSGGKCTMARMIIPPAELQKGSVFCFQNASCSYPGNGNSSPGECLKEEPNSNGNYMPLYDGIAEIQWYLNSQKKSTQQSCVPNTHFYETSNTGFLIPSQCYSSPIYTYPEYGFGFYKHTFYNSGMFSIMLKARASSLQLEYVGSNNSITMFGPPGTDPESLSTETRQIEIVDCETVINISNNSDISANAQDNVIRSGYVNISAAAESISMGNATGLFSVEAYNEIVITSEDNNEFSTAANTEVMFTCREKPPLINCTLEPVGPFNKSGLHDPDYSDAIHIYPNPTRGTVTIELSSDSQIVHGGEIYNSLGMMVREFNTMVPDSKIEIDLSGFSEGLYFIRVLLNDNVYYMSKIIKQD